MTLKSLVLALLAGLAAFLVVGIAVTEFTQPWIEFSLFVGLPAGLLAGVATTAAVSLGLRTDASAHRRRLAGSVAGFGIGFLATVLTASLLGSGVVIGVVVAVGVGLIVAVATYLRESTTETEMAASETN